MSSVAERHPRITSIDALRGLIMITMALDHVRDYFHSAAMRFQPEDLARTTYALFFTRWITHFCAPVFMFTAGLGAFFWLSRGRTKAELTRFLLTRGLWLVFLDLTVIRFAMTFGLVQGLVILNVLWALGWSMVVLAALIHLPLRSLVTLSIAGIALHNLGDSLTSQFGLVRIWNALHQLIVFRAGPATVLSAYPLVPWVFVMSSGFCFGHIMKLEPQRRQQWMLRIGLGLTIAFIVIRGINAYGDPVPWTRDRPGMTLLSFLRCNKYPPSLDFLLMTLGPAILLLGWLDRKTMGVTNPLLVFGRVPLFYFIAHLFLLHLLTIPLAFIRYGHARFLLNPMPTLGGDPKLYPPDYGYELWVVYALWFVVVALLYPLCRWFAQVKQRRRDWWLSYL